MTWRYLAESGIGTSHRQLGKVCQDQCRCTPYWAGGMDYLLIACADGAGSASHADVGARVACEAMMRLLARALDDGDGLGGTDRATVVGWEHWPRCSGRSPASMRTERDS